MAVHFDGYSLDTTGRPTFRYSLDSGGRGAVLTVAESFAPVKATAATGFSRHFSVEAPGRYHAWLLVGQSVRNPRVVAPADRPAPVLDLKSDEPLVPAGGVRLVLPQDGDRAVVIEASGAPEGSVWRLVPSPGGGWYVLSRLPESREGWKGSFEVITWALPKDDDALLKSLSAK
jgi:hypothetical protein